MKKSKNIICASIASVLLVSAFTPALAKETHYYGDFTIPQTDFSEFKYERYNMADFDAIIEKARNLMKSEASEKNITDMEGILSEFNDQLLKLDTCFNFTYILMSQNNTEENINENATAKSLNLEADKKYREIITEMAATDYRKALVFYFGDEEALNEFLGNNHTDEYYSLSDDEQALLSNYFQNQFGSYILKTDDGKELSYEDIYNMIRDIKKRRDEEGETDELKAEKEKALDLYNQYYDDSRQIIGDIYLKLINIRNKIAKEEGYDNYVDYAYEKIYDRDFTIEDALKFSEGVKNYIVPVASDILSVSSTAEHADYSTMTDEKIIDTLKPCFDDMSSELSAAFDYVLAYNMYDWDYSTSKVQPGSAYTAYLSSYKTPYMFFSPDKEGQRWKFGTMIHEFGHFNTMLHDPVHRSDFESNSKTMSLDVAEVNSQGLELLMMHYYKDIFGSHANTESLNTIATMMYTLTSCGLLTEFENAAFTHPDITLDELSKTYIELSEKYGLGSGDADSDNWWITVPHIFESPLYYISYGTSLMSALDIWMQSQTDFDVACDKYFRLSALGDSIDFQKSLSDCDLENIFTEEYSQKLANTLKKKFGLDYSDVNKEDWYFSPVFATLDYINGNSDTEYGIGKNASRAVVADGIAKLCNDDFDGVMTTFADVPEDDIYIGWVQEKGIVEGYDDVTFGYNDDVTREQAVAMLYRCANALELDTSETDTSVYTDSTSISDWAAQAIMWANAEGLINGYDDGSFKPQNNVTKEEFAQMLYQFMGIVY
ncbi:MAG: S-layer homology domain-containing protein [Hominilimicola sp.]